MRILFLSENFPPETNAAATRVFERAVYWAGWGHEVTVITCAPNFPQGKLLAGYENRWYQSEKMDGIRVVRVKTYISANQGVTRRTLDFLSFLAAGFTAGAFQPAFDVVAATSPQFFAAVAGWAVGAVRRRPFVFELGDLWPGSISAVGAMKRGALLGLMENLELFLYRRSAAIAALTQSFKEDLVGRGIAPEKISVVVNGVDQSRYAPRPRHADLAREWNLADKFTIGYVGTHGMAHRLDCVLAAAENLQGEENIRFLFVGAGAEREALIETAHRKKLDNVVFIPPQPKEAMPDIWSLCDIALVHLRDQPLFAGVIPSKIFEAMAMGLPVLLAAPEGEASRIITRHANGVWVPPEQPAELARAARELYADGAGRNRMKEASLTAAPLYSRETQAEKMINVLDRARLGTGAG
jgi:glycosyltransferase involved in cell wall biosynthesis